MVVFFKSIFVVKFIKTKKICDLLNQCVIRYLEVNLNVRYIKLRYIIDIKVNYFDMLQFNFIINVKKLYYYILI